ncbi:MAG: sugar ABC transporter substrate-binding protein [Eubacteriales bacterium]|nr:sugar ABC transporter substrate-binding protein [Eubacteriales bacterium]
MKKNKGLFLLCFLGISIIFIICTAVLVGTDNKNNRGEKRKKIGIVYMTMNNPYFNVINKEIVAVARDRGDDVITRDSGLDADMQIRQVEEFIEEKVDIIIINAVDSKKILPALKKAKKANIPVIALDTECDSDYVDAIITSNNYRAGVMAAEDLMERRDGGRILILEHVNNKSSHDRIEGFLYTLKKEKKPFEIIDRVECYGQLEIAAPVVEGYLKKGEKIDVIMALNDPAALGAMAALDNQGKLDGVLVYGVDGAPEAKAMIYKGMMTATIAQSPTKTGKMAANYMYTLMEGHEVVKKSILPVTFISSDNIEKYSLTNWE